jgi:SAM-dependent methyltransferase
MSQTDLAGGLDERMQSIVTLLGYAPFATTDVVLDIGMGGGQITAALARRVKRVVGTGVESSSYGVTAAELRRAGIEAVEGVVEHLPFGSDSFDGVVMAHVLEHVPNLGLALNEARRVLRPNGLLCVFVPPREDAVLGGHIAVGWNIGQLMYVLAVHGFDTALGNYVRFGYNICAFVRPDARPLPRLRHDFGDLRTLADAQRFPVPIGNADPQVEAFNGELAALNWPWTELLPQRSTSWAGRLLRWLVPNRFKQPIARFLRHAIGAVLYDPAQGDPEVNPRQLKI